MTRWNVRLPAPLQAWNGRGAFESALASAGGKIIRVLPNLPWVTIDLPNGLHPIALPGAGYAEQDKPIEPLVQSIGVDLKERSWATVAVRAHTIHTITKGVGVRIGVLDTGLKPHPELEGADIRSQTSLVPGDTDPTDNHGHGTAVLSIMAAQGLSLLPQSGLRRYQDI
jgi:subtilisin family serine protease